MGRMRILFISNLYPNPHSPHIASFSRQQIAALRTLSDVDVVAPIAWPERLRASIPFSYTTNDGLEIYHPTYLYTPGILRSLYGNYYLASIRSVVSKLFRERHYDCIYSSWLYPDAWAAARLAGAYGLPLFVNVVGTDVNRLCARNSITEKSLWVAREAQRVFAVSNKLKESLVALGADPHKIEVVYNGVDRKVFRPMNKQQLRREMGLPEGRTTILFVGNLKKEKGCGELAEAFAHLVHARPDLDLELIIIGSGSFGQKMQETLKAESVLGRAKFLGSRPIEEVAKWMNICDLFCLPSYMEGQPNVVIEALSCQTRVVATNVGGIPELDKGLGNIRLIEPRSVVQLKDALGGMLQIIDALPVESKFICSWHENADIIYGFFNNNT